jgi:hypothetical protein
MMRFRNSRNLVNFEHVVSETDPPIAEGRSAWRRIGRRAKNSTTASLKHQAVAFSQSARDALIAALSLPVED